MVVVSRWFQSAAVLTKNEFHSWSVWQPRLCQPERLVAAEPAAVGECTSEMRVGLAQLNIAQQLYSAYCTAGWMWSVIKRPKMVFIALLQTF